MHCGPGFLPLQGSARTSHWVKSGFCYDFDIKENNNKNYNFQTLISIAKRNQIKFPWAHGEREGGDECFGTPCSS